MTWDVVIVGAGAAGLATGIFTRAPRRDCSVLLLDGARKVGAKILVSGGSRCNVTNTVVTERDYWGGPSAVVRRVLRAYPASEAAAFFTAAGVRLHEEEDGKLFPDSHRSRDVLDALLRQVHASGCVLRESSRVARVEKNGDRFLVTAAGEPVESRFLILATGGMSLPRSGSDGGGYAIAQSLGHTIVPPTPALAPLVIDAGHDRMHSVLSGVSVEAELTLWVDGAVVIRLRGPLLWTHFGISGPVALNMSRHLLRAQLEGRAAGLTASFMPAGSDFEKADRFLQDEIADRPRGTVTSLLGRLLPSSMAAAFAERLGVDPSAQLAHLGRDARRVLTRALTEWRLDVQGSRGYNYAEVTAGGVDLREIVPATMESRVCPGLYLVGEILDVDGRLGGFNFQWAWSSAHVAARALRDRKAGLGVRS